MKKITVIGAGNVGATTAQLIAQKGLAHVVLLDIADGLAKGKALDIQEACPLWGSSSKVLGASSYEETTGSDIVVITAGLARKPGMSRDDLLRSNAAIVKAAAEQIRQSSPEAIVIVVTNPMDVMAWLIYKVTGFPAHRIIGMGGILDASRFAAFIADELKVSPDSIKGLVLGGHGDSMVPMPRFTTIAGIALPNLMQPERMQALIERTRQGGAEIAGYLKTGSAFYAPGASVVEIIEAILFDKGKILPCSVYLEGEYGIDGIFTGVPVKISAKGVEEIVILDLTEEERTQLHASALAVNTLVNTLEI
ncbi:MAG TPA: malate dehydrogenase [Thermodesulfovibrionia bacterium]|nr:malate dehydrogenase [Thermodesulfovibrionia bacterium]